MDQGATDQGDVPEVTGGGDADAGTAVAEGHGVVLDDGTVVTWQSWALGPRRKDGAAVRHDVLRDGETVAEYVRVGHEEAIALPDGEWDLDVSGNGALVALLPDGRRLMAAPKDRRTMSRAKVIDVDFGAPAAAQDPAAAQALAAADAERADGPPPAAAVAQPEGAVIVCEGSQNYVIEDAARRKLGQFTGASHGVRAAEIQFDTPEGRALDDDRKLFLTWTARKVLESRMMSMTWVLTVCLLLLIAYLVYIWML